jgi:radical SAM superfamily enzyme YgiQ (UPF0313 family)
LTEDTQNHSESKEADEILRQIFRGHPISKVLLINPPDIDITLFDYGTTKRGRSSNYPPYGLTVIAKHLINYGVEVKICNLNHEVLSECKKSEDSLRFDFESVWKSKLASDVDEFQPDIVGATCLFSVTHDSFVNVCKEVKSISPSWLEEGDSLPLVVGGVNVTQDVEQVLKDVPEVNFIFLHEAELAFLHFVEVVNGKRSSADLAQLIISGPSSRLEFSKRVLPQEAQLNIVPAFDLIDLKKYSDVGTMGSWYGFKEKGTRFATVLSNRGCRAACTFCNVRFFNGAGVRHRSIDSVLDELTCLHETFGVEHIVWLDDDLLHDEKRAISLFNGMAKKNLNMTWDATNGVIAYSCCNEELVAAAAASGCIGLYLGIESGNPDVLKQIKKPGTVEVFERAAETIRKFEQIYLRLFLIIGFPDETLKMMFDSIHLAERMRPDWCNISILQPWKKTPIYDAMIERGLLGEKEETSEEDEKLAPYNIGPYSRQRAIESGKIVQASDLNDMFAGMDLDSVPSGEALDDVWFYMNYRLNFHAILHEERQVKLEQQLKFLTYVHTLSAPDNALAIYFLAYLQKMVLGKSEEAMILKLEKRLSESQYWQDRFVFFGLSVDHLRTGQFPSGDELFRFQEDCIKTASN